MIKVEFNHQHEKIWDYLPVYPFPEDGWRREMPVREVTGGLGRRLISPEAGRFLVRILRLSIMKSTAGYQNANPATFLDGIRRISLSAARCEAFEHQVFCLNEHLEEEALS